MLNRLRVGECTHRTLNLLNQRVSYSDDTEDYSVILSAYRKRVDLMNEQKLAALEGEEFCYTGKVTGKFGAKDFIVPEQLKLKVGAQVIFCKNISRSCVNGTIAKVSSLSEETITVNLGERCGGECGKDGVGEQRAGV